MSQVPLPTNPLSPVAFDHVLFYGREYAEVLAMVALEEEALRGKRILDCPSGPDAFVADATARGFDVIGCDPLYSRPLAEIMATGRADVAVCLQKYSANPDFAGHIDVTAFDRTKIAALERFAEDFPTGQPAGRYVTASLPHLPFADKSFDLVLSANLLFTYSSSATGGIAEAGTLDLDFHLHSIQELMRVCRGELRVYPVMTHGKSRIHPYAAQIIGQLAAKGVEMTFVESSYVQGRFTGHLVLVVDCTA